MIIGAGKDFLKKVTIALITLYKIMIVLRLDLYLLLKQK